AAAFNLILEGAKFRPTDPAFVPFPLAVDRPPAPEAIAAIVRKGGQASRGAAGGGGAVGFIAPPPGEVGEGGAGERGGGPGGRGGPAGKSSPSAAGRRSTRWSPARRAPGSRHSCTRSSRTWR